MVDGGLNPVHCSTKTPAVVRGTVFKIPERDDGKNNYVCFLSSIAFIEWVCISGGDVSSITVPGRRNSCNYALFADDKFDDDDEFTYDFRCIDIYSMKLVLSATQRTLRRTFLFLLHDCRDVQNR